MIEADYPEGASPLSADEMEGLLPTHITNRAELDRWEQDNINEALAWIEGHEPKAQLRDLCVCGEQKSALNREIRGSFSFFAAFSVFRSLTKSAFILSDFVDFYFPSRSASLRACPELVEWGRLLGE